MKRNYFFIALSVVAVAGCTPKKTEVESTPAIVSDHPSASTGEQVEIQFYHDNMDREDQNRIFKFSSGVELEKTLAAISNDVAPLYKCGYGGRLIITKGNDTIRDAQFNLTADCPHVGWMEGEKIITKKFTPEGLKFLNDLQVSPYRLSELEWMLGKWMQSEGVTIAYETWVKESETSFQGTGVSLVGADTVFQESLTIRSTGNEIHYIANVPGNAQPVPFKLISLMGTKAIFTNPKHDWPQKITYRKMPNGSLAARVEGPVDGSNRAKDFNFVPMLE